MNLKRKICIVTGSRAEYGLLYCLLKEINLDTDLELQLVVTGMHLSHEYGYSIERIREDGFNISEIVEILLSSNSHAGMAKSSGIAMISFADTFKRLSPDILVLLGDRFEAFSAAATANMMNIPVAHIHGGELSYGAIDDSLRHAITKLSNLHFPVTDVYRNRILQMGESAARTFNYGAPGLDYLDNCHKKSRFQLSSELNVKFLAHSFLITVHSETKKNDNSLLIIEELTEALDKFEDTTLIFTEANCDAGGQIINKYLKTYCAKNKNAYLFKQLGFVNYISLVDLVDVVIGNSSSGVIEVPCLRKPSVNIGCRQDGRYKPNSVIDVSADKSIIMDAILKAKSAEFILEVSNTVIPFKQKHTSKRIKEKLKEVSLNELSSKRFEEVTC